MNSFRSLFLIAAGLATVGLPCATRADDTTPSAPPVDKSQYNLFNMTPADQLRPLAFDADDGVSDPTTVDAGHVEIQGSLVDYYHYSTTYRGSVNFNEENFDWDPRISIGLLDNVDLFIHPDFHYKSYSYSGSYNYSKDSSGYDGINIGTKINLWGNDEGMTALAIAPYISIPNDGGTVLGGADIPFAVRLPDQFYLKFVVDLYAFDHGNDSVFFGAEDSMSLHKMFFQKLDAYVYLDTTCMSDGTPWYGYSGFGLGYQIIPDLEVFAGIGFGLTSNAYDYNPRFGLAWRF